MNHCMPPYSEYRLQDAANRLEGVRCCVGFGQLNDDLQVAIECLHYVKDQLRLSLEEPVVQDTNKKPHLVVIDYGFAGQFYACSKCEKGSWDAPKGNISECPYCHVLLDPDEIEYGVD